MHFNPFGLESVPATICTIYFYIRTFGVTDVHKSSTHKPRVWNVYDENSTIQNSQADLGRRKTVSLHPSSEVTELLENLREKNIPVSFMF